jgi:Helix-turn-helix domain
MSSKAFTAKVFRWLHQVNTDLTLPASAIKVAVYLCSYFNEAEGGVAWPACMTIAAAIGLSEHTVIRAVRLLEAHRHLRIKWGKQGRGCSNRYWMVEKDPHQGELFEETTPQPAKVFEEEKPAPTQVLTPEKPAFEEVVKPAPASRKPAPASRKPAPVQEILSKNHRRSIEGEKRASHARATTPDFAPHDEKKAGREPARTPAEAQAVPAESFEEFWRVYPRQINQDDARAAFAKALKAGADADAIIARAKVYAVERTAAINGGDGPQWTLYPATWLKKRKWIDPLPEGLVVDHESGEVVAIEQPPPERGRDVAEELEAERKALYGDGLSPGWDYHWLPEHKRPHWVRERQQRGRRQ